MHQTLETIASEAERNARVASRLAVSARHLPRVAHFAQVAVGWAGVLRHRASGATVSASTDLAEYSDFHDRSKRALAGALAEVMTEQIGSSLNDLSRRNTPPPLDLLLGRYPADTIEGIPYDTWSAAWSLVREQQD